jgi:hypothetical protein
MRRLAAAATIAALSLFVWGPARAAADAAAADSRASGASGSQSGGCAIAAPGIPATLTGFGLIVGAIALGHRRRQ